MFLNTRLVISVTLLSLQPHAPCWILNGAQNLLVAVGDAVLKRKSKLIYVSHQVRFAALRGRMKKINLGKEDVPLTNEFICAPMQRDIEI